jgi:AraC-like DNA-binding protein
MPKRPTPRRRSFQGPGCLVPELKMVGYDQFVRASATLGEHVHHDAYEICYLLAGSVEWWAGDDVTEVGPGEVYITRPNERHGGTDAFMHPCELLWIQVAFPLAGLTKPDAAALAAAFAGINLRTFPASQGVAKGIEAILDEHDAPGVLATVAVRAAIHEMLVQVLRDHDAATQRASARSESDVIRRAVRWMDEHLTEDYAIDDVAAAVGLKPSRFHERFATETGFTPAEHRTRQRVRRAKQLLRTTEAPVTDIAFSLGFSTSQYFATVFKSQVGLTPVAYRNRTQS